MNNSILLTIYAKHRHSFQGETNIDKQYDRRGRVGLSEPPQGHLTRLGAQTSLLGEAKPNEEPREGVSQAMW